MKNIYIVLISLVFVACGNSEKTEEDTAISTSEITLTQQQFDSEQMQLGTVAEQAFDETVKVSGMIDVPSHNKSTVSTFVGGYITNTPLLIGDKVKKGQFLVSLENTEYVEIQQQYLEVAEQLSYLKSEFERQKTLYEEKISSQKSYLQAESTYKSALAHYNGLRKKLQMMHINPTSVEQGAITSTISLYAPIDGYVTKVHVSNGTYVSAADPILELIDTDHIHLELFVFEKDILNVKEGQPIRFRIPEASDQSFNAEVHLVGTVIDDKTRRVTVHGHIDDEHTGFIVGMFAEADILIEKTNRYALPKEAVIEVDDDFFVLVLKEKTDGAFHFEKVKVTIGKQTETYMEVIGAEGLKDKQLLVKGTYMLLTEGEGGHGH
ncbi:MAG: efflux RND transporter periplasmic adaptor subunit [Altibacter sp.]|uniref:efflux RND transporter periplasmic adaptor subunit n=1 Tax=Altibacter sp. TaxID=2024823 RepID=UPI001DE0384E|nr:efflux RND transporter periplasmic adaptor subunit [Altibacter sp.]MBZ0326806.1 efflux RND transporter periplasmic adaptor subunit [Altibacter sp.]